MTNENRRPASAPTVDELNRRRDVARELRSALLGCVRDELYSVLDLVDWPAGTGPLDLPAVQSVPLHQLLAAQPAWNRQRAATALVAVRELLRLPDAERVTRWTVGWLLDGRASRRRLESFRAVVSRPVGPPWPGYPLTTSPRETVG